MYLPKVISIVGQIMDYYDFSVQIAEQKLIETIIITLSTEELKEKNE